jgi:hypothetical protein
MKNYKACLIGLLALFCMGAAEATFTNKLVEEMSCTYAEQGAAYKGGVVGWWLYENYEEGKFIGNRAMWVDDSSVPVGEAERHTLQAAKKLSSMDFTGKLLSDTGKKVEHKWELKMVGVTPEQKDVWLLSAIDEPLYSKRLSCTTIHGSSSGSSVALGKNDIVQQGDCWYKDEQVQPGVAMPAFFSWRVFGDDNHVEWKTNLHDQWSKPYDRVVLGELMSLSLKNGTLRAKNSDRAITGDWTFSRKKIGDLKSGVRDDEWELFKGKGATIELEPTLLICSVSNSGLEIPVAKPAQ